MNMNEKKTCIKLLSLLHFLIKELDKFLFLIEKQKN